MLFFFIDKRSERSKKGKSNKSSIRIGALPRTPEDQGE